MVRLCRLPIAARLAARTTTHLPQQNRVLKRLPRQILVGIPIAVLGLAAAIRRSLRGVCAVVTAEPPPPIVGDEADRTLPTGPSKQPQFRAFARTRRLQFRGFYDRIGLAKSFVFITITYIIRTKHLRSRKLGWALDQRLQRNSRLLANQQRVGQIGFRLPVADPRNPRLAALYAERKLGLRLARLGEIRRQVGIRAPEPSSHVSWSVMQLLQPCQYPKTAFYDIPATRYQPYV